MQILESPHRLLPPISFINIFTSDIFQLPPVLFATVISVLPMVCRAASDTRFAYCEDTEFALLRIVLSRLEALEDAEL